MKTVIVFFSYITTIQNLLALEFDLIIHDAYHTHKSSIILLKYLSSPSY